MKYREIQTLAATDEAISWTVYVMDDFDVPRIDLVFASAPTTEGSITIEKDSSSGADFDAVINTTDPVGKTSISITGLQGFAKGDKLSICYANPDEISITGTATIEIP